MSVKQSVKHITVLNSVTVNSACKHFKGDKELLLFFNSSSLSINN